MKKNWFFIVIMLGVVVIFLNRYVYLAVPVVSHPDSQVSFGTQDEVMEQTWQPEIKEITGISIPYYAQDSFTCDVKMAVFSDDYSEVLVEAVQKDRAFLAEESGNIDFRFERTALIQGERYRIQVSLVNAEESGTLQIASGSNYGGCSIADREVGQAVALTITFAKFSRVFWLMAVLFPLLSFSLLFMTVTGKKWEETVGVSLFLEGIILYCFGCAEHLVWGINAIYILAAAGILLAMLLFNRKRLELKSYLSAGLLIYMVMFAVIIVCNNGDWLGYRDELRHWGIAVRDMFYFDSFAKHAGTTVILPRYLPFATLIEYLFEYMNGMFNESILFISYHTMLLSVLIILCRPLQGKSGIRRIFPVMSLMICVPVIFFNNISNSIMVDSLLAVIVAYILICYYSDKMTWFNMMRISTALVALTLTKDMGLVLGGLTVLIMLGDSLLMQIKEKNVSLKKLMYPVLCGILVLAVYFSWQAYLSIPTESDSKATVQAQESGLPGASEIEDTSASDGMQGMQDVGGGADSAVQAGNAGTVSTSIRASNVTLGGLLQVIKGEGEEYQYQVTRNFLVELFDGKTYSFGFFSFSFADLLALLALFVFSLGYFGYWQVDKTRMYVFGGLFFIMGVCLCAFLQVMYWFSFSMYEALELTSFSRYLGPFICALIIVTLYLVFKRAYDEKNSLKLSGYLMSVIAFFLVVAMPTEGIVVEGKDIEGNTTDEITYGHNEIAEILRSVGRRGERAFFICSNSDGYSEYVFRNTVCPIFSEHDYWNTVSTQELFQEQYILYGNDNIDDNGAWIFPTEEWKNELRKCQYLVIFHADELFCRSYAEVLGSSVEIEDGSVYRVIINGANVSLEFIGRTGIKGWH